MLDETAATHKELQQTHAATLEELAWYKRWTFGRRRERFTEGEGQGHLFELDSSLPPDESLKSATPDAEAETEVKSHQRRKRRQIDWDKLPQVRHEHDLSPAEKMCSCCSRQMHRISEDVTRELEFEPAKLVAHIHVRPKYACPRCKHGVCSAPVPPRPIPGGIAGPGLITEVLVGKFGDPIANPIANPNGRAHVAAGYFQQTCCVQSQRGLKQLKAATSVAICEPADGRGYVDEGRMEPLQLGVLAGVTPADVECVLYDDRIEQIPYDEPTDLAAITVEIYTARRAYEIAAEYRSRGVPVIMGGFHPTLAPDECRQHADSIYIGDAESLWTQVVEDARQGRLQDVYRAKPGIPQPGGSQPRRELFKGKGYLPITLMQFSRGCRFACDFCAISVFFNRTQYVRRTEEVLAEIENQDRKLIFFVDDNFLSDHDAAKVFLRSLIPMRIKWVSQASIDMTNDRELMELLAESGCIGNVIGFESINPDNLKAMKKATNLTRGANSNPLNASWDRYQAQCEIPREYNLQTWAAFTLGHDCDTVESIRETFDFAMRNRFCFAAFNILMPYPGTPLYDRLQRENRLLWNGQWWLHPEYRFNHAAFVPKNMTPDELTEACWQCRYEWNKTSSIFHRMWDFKTHMSSLYRLAVYLKYNPIYSREAYRKQGMLFGLFPKRPHGRSVAKTPDEFVALDKSSLAG